MRWCWVNFQRRGVLLIWIIAGQGPTALAVSAGGGLFGHFSSHLSFLFSFSHPWKRARYRLKYCLKGRSNPKQPTNRPKVEVRPKLLGNYGPRKFSMGYHSRNVNNNQKCVQHLLFLCTATKSGGVLCYTLRTFECLSVRPSVIG